MKNKISVHDFQPILNEPSFKEAIDYIAEQVLKLGQTAVGENMNIDTLTIFTHQADEYDYLANFVKKFGNISKFTHGKTLYIDSDLTVLDQQIKYLGVRQPDRSRPQVGYGDFPIEDYNDFYKRNLNNEFIKKTQSGRGQPLIEIWHPDFDVLGYIVNAKEH